MLALAFTQAVPLSADDDAAASPSPGELSRATLALDIATASFYELVAWCESLGLPTSGGIAELRARLYERYRIEAPPEVKGSGRTVTIEHAAAAESFRLEEVPGSLVRLSGGVILTVREEGRSELHRLEAGEVLYDRERNALSAKGGVRYRREGPLGREEFFGETLAVDLDDWSGVFLDGKLRRLGEGAKEGERGFAFTAETIEKRSKDLVLLERAVLSACDADAPHYAVRAKRVWLLGPGEWAIADAVLSVGEVPLLWLPFFYYPGDELVFHPVLGYRSREGRFVQTTTYLVGRKPAKTQTGIFGMANSSRGKAELRGLFLHPTGEAASADAKDAPTLKLLADVYSGLGAFIGLDGQFGAAPPFERLQFSAGLGVSRTLYLVGSFYTPYAEASDWESAWNASRFLSLELPLRYGLDLQTSVRLGGIQANLALPLYSDPFFEQDFRYRSEDMEWLRFASSSTDTTASSTTSSYQPSKRSSYAQRLDVSGSIKLPELFSPWLSQVSLSRFSSAVSWLSKAATPSPGVYDPSREFFYPDLVRPFDLALSLKGSLIPTGKKASASADKDADGGATSGLADALSPKAARAPWASTPWQDEAAPPVRERSADSADAPNALSEAPRVPPRVGDQEAAQNRRPFDLQLEWNLSPAAFLEERFLSEIWTSSAAIDFARMYRLLSYRLSGGLSLSAKVYEELLSASLALAWTSQEQWREAGSLPLAETRTKAYALSDAQYRQEKLSAGLKLSTHPFADSWLWGQSSLGYTLELPLYSLVFADMGTDGPSYTTSYASWSANGVSSHTAFLTLALRTGGTTQSLGLSMSLPPTTEAYAATLALAAGEGSAKASLGLKGRIYRPALGGSFSFDPLAATLAAEATPGLKLSDSLSYDIATGDVLANSATLSLGPLSATLLAKRSKAYKLNPASGWISTDVELFRATELTMNLKADWKSPVAGPAALDCAFNAVYAQNLLRFSESSLSLSLSMSLKVNKFLDISFSSLSQNSAVWRYWPWAFPAAAELPGGATQWYKDPVTDLVESFSLWDPQARKRSLFKLKSLSLKATHDLHDWDLSLELSASPTLDTSKNPYTYVLEPKFSILLAWRDVPEIKTTVKRDATNGLSY